VKPHPFPRKETVAVKKSILLIAIGLTLNALAVEPAKPDVAGKPSANSAPSSPSKFTAEYEGRTYAFPDEASLAKWKADREASLYQQIGGKVAIDAAVERFYVKVLADDRIKHFFDDVDMVRQRAKQKAFLSAALGGPIPWEGKDMRKAHAKLPGLNDSHFNAVAENLQATLTELNVKKELVDKVMAIAESTRADVLNRPKK
jgi:hemoglobin